MPTTEIAVKEFLLACRADGLKPASLRWYRTMLKDFTTQHYGKQLEAITASDMRHYIASLRDRSQRYVRASQRPTIAGGLSHESLRAHLRGLRRFFLWAWTEYQLPPLENPMLKIRMPGRERHEPKAITVADLDRLLNACDETTLIGLRNKAMLTFLADTGCRAGGLLSLRRANLHLYEGYAIVNEKGSRDRAVPFLISTANLIQKWLDVRPLDAHPEFVFCSLATNTFGEPLTLSGLHGMLKRLKKEAGVSGRVNPHSFRHGFAREYLRNGGDLGTLSQIMGHSDVSVTVGSYAIFKDQELAQVHSKFSPMRGRK
jgi:site-specific recombinase XerD